MKPPRPTVKARSISFVKMEQLAKRKEVDLYVRSLGVIAADPIAEELRKFERLGPDKTPASVLSVLESGHT